MIVCTIFVVVLADYQFVQHPVIAAQFYPTTANDVTGILNRRHAEEKLCQLPPPLKNGHYSPSPARCKATDTSPTCRMVPGTYVDDMWPIFYECEPGYKLKVTEGEETKRHPSVCLRGQWVPKLPVCLESHYNSETLPQFLSSNSICGKPASHLRSKRKVSGSVSRKGAWPWMVILGMQKNTTTNAGIHWFCAGTLVTTRHILTAAHCVADYRRRTTFFARFNDVYLDSPADDDGVIEVQIQKNNIVVHPGFKKEQVFSHNLAIIKLDAALTVTDFVKPVCLPTPDFSVRTFDNEIAYFTSWGQTDNDREWSRKRRYEPVLHDIRATMVNHAECNYNYRNYQSDDFIIVDWDLICASVPNNKSCQGDAGSPLMLKVKDSYVMIGIVATPFRCYDEQFPRLFTRLSKYMENWIIPTLKL